MGMSYTSGGWRVYTVDQDRIDRPMRFDENVRAAPGAISMWRPSGGVQVDMYYAGLIDVKKYTSVSTYGISGCNALAIVRLAGSVTTCWFGHSTCNMTEYFTHRAVGMLGALGDCHAVLVENSTRESKEVASILIDAGLPPARLLVYTNLNRRGDQTFGVRFSDGLFGEVNWRVKTEPVTRPRARNDFIQGYGFDTKPETKTPYQMITYLNSDQTRQSQYMTMFGHMDIEIYGDQWFTTDEEVMGRRIREHGDRAVTSYLGRLKGHPEREQVRAYLQKAFADFQLSALR